MLNNAKKLMERNKYKLFKQQSYWVSGLTFGSTVYRLILIVLLLAAHFKF
jgi:hypothetical protein